MEKAAYYFYGLLFTLVMLTLLGLYIYKRYFSQKYTRERFDSSFLFLMQNLIMA